MQTMGNEQIGPDDIEKKKRKNNRLSDLRARREHLRAPPKLGEVVNVR